MNGLNSAIDAAASALNAQRARMEVAVSNLANADSTTGPDGEAYRRRDVVLESTPGQAFDGALGATGVRVAGVVEDPTAVTIRHEPGNPNADKDGNVTVPDVNVSDEMVNLVSAARAYQANLQAIGLIKETMQRALDLAK
jgi:flagellar basal-body rod protein FlgC